MWCRKQGSGFKKKQIQLLLLMMSSVLLSGCEQSGLAPDQLTLGISFPELNVSTLQGEPISLDARLKDKVVLLNIWATWCPPCRKELPSLEKLEQIIKDPTFAVVGLSIDNDVDLVQEYLSDQGVTYNNYVDLNGQETNEKLGIVAYPYTFLIGKNGRLVARYVGEQVWHTRSMVDQIMQEINKFKEGRKNSE